MNVLERGAHTLSIVASTCVDTKNALWFRVLDKATHCLTVDVSTTVMVWADDKAALSLLELEILANTAGSVNEVLKLHTAVRK